MMHAYRNTAVYLALTLPIVVLGFWPTYFSVLGTARLSIHTHSLLMVLWVVMLMTQARLARAGPMSWHRGIGKSSYVIAPLMLWFGVVVSHESIQRGTGTVTPDELQLLTFPLGGLLSFAVTYSLAIFYRRQRELHSRFMISSGLAVMGGAIIRVYLFWVPGMGTLGLAGNANFITLELLTGLLLWRDWRLGGPRAPYVVMLLLLGLNHLMFDLAEGWLWWEIFAEAFYHWPSFAPWGPPG